MSDRLHVATRKGLFTVRRQGKGWSIADAALLGEPVTAVLFDPRDGRGYAATHHGHFGVKLFRSDDGGQSWQPCTMPAYPPKPEEAKDVCPMRGIPIPWNVEMIWILEAGEEPGEVWCGTLPGGLFHSADAGQSWRFIQALWDRPERKKWCGGGYDYPGIHSVCVDPRDGAVRVGLSCGGVWCTLDKGDTWVNQTKGMRNAYMPPDQAYDTDVQDAHRVVQCPAQPDRLWTQHHNGIFISSDSSLSWQEIEEAGPSVFGFAAAVHPHDGDTAWFVPATKDEMRIPRDGKLVVTRTRDGGKSFEVLTQGLPQEHAYDLVYRHGLDVDRTGERLAFGSTTGSLFVSEDAGDSWKHVSAHLPPINVVRFG